MYFSQLMQHSAAMQTAVHPRPMKSTLVQAGDVVIFARHLGIPAAVLDSYIETHYPLCKSFQTQLFECHQTNIQGVSQLLKQSGSF